MGAESGFVVVYFLVISLQNDVKEVFVVLTALMKSHPISSPAAVIFEMKNNECTSPLYSKKHVFLIHAILYTSHVKGPCKWKLLMLNINVFVVHIICRTCLI